MPPSFAHHRTALLLVLLLPALVKVFFLEPVDLFEAHTIAVEWLTTGQFRFHHLGVWHSSYQFPVFPAMVAGLLWSGAGEYGVLVFQLLCSVGSAWLVYQLGMVLFREQPHMRLVALGAALLTGLSPFLVVYHVRMIHPFAWDMLLALALLLMAFTARPDRPASMLWLAFVAGIALLNRPTLIALAVPFLWINRSFLFSPASLGVKLVMLLLLITPTTTWVLRNHAIHGHYSLSTATGQNLWIGLQEATEGTAQLPDGRYYVDLLSPSEIAALSSTDAAGQSDLFTQKWKAELRSRPGLWWRMMGVKLRNFWLYRSHLGLDHADGRGTWAFVLYKVYAVVLLALIIAAFRLRSPQVRVLLFTLFLYSVVQALFYVETRHRLLVEPLLMLLALSVVVTFYQRGRTACASTGT